MDPTARRETWDIIKQVKQDKIIILTTHYMDEAEILADRVAIISKGSLQTCGTPLFLKKKFGQGYFIQVTPTSENRDDLAKLQDLLHEHKRLSSANNLDQSLGILEEIR